MQHLWHLHRLLNTGQIYAQVPNNRQGDSNENTQHENHYLCSVRIFLHQILPVHLADNTS